MKSSPARPDGEPPRPRRRSAPGRAGRAADRSRRPACASRPPPRPRRAAARRAAPAGASSCRRRWGRRCRPARPRWSTKSTPVSTRPLAEALGDPLGLDHHLREPRRLGHLQLRRLRPREAALGHQLARPLDARLALGAPRLDPAPEPGHLLRNPALALVLGPGRELLVLQLLLQVGLVVAGVAGDAGARRDLDDAVHQVVEEVAVVRDEQQRAGELVQLLLQPVHRVRVEVVGGLVEQQQVGPREQRPGDGHALAEAAGELGHRAIPLAHAEPVEQAPRLVGGVPAAQVLDPVAQRGGQLGEQPLVLRLVPLRLEPGDEPRVRVERGLEGHPGHLELGGDRGAGGELRLLRQVGDAGAAPELHLPAVRLGGAGQDAHERGLARPVHAHQPNPLALLDGEGELLEDGAAAEGEAEPGRVQERHRAFIAPARRRRARPRDDSRSTAAGGIDPRAREVSLEIRRGGR